MNKKSIEYGVGKAGTVQMTKYLAVHWRRNQVRCNCISPDPFANPSLQLNNPALVERLAQKTPRGRFRKSEEIAGTVFFLLSVAASYITGHNMFVDGGWTAW